MLLLLVVYLTLLRPDSGDQLPGAVTAEQGRELDANGSFGASPGERRGGPESPPGGEAAPGGGPAAGPPSGPGGLGAGAGGAGEQASRGLGGPSGELDGSSPAEDQYEDALSGLLGRVRAAH